MQFTNNESNFAQIFFNSSNIQVMNVSWRMPIQYLNSVQNVHQLQKTETLVYASCQREWKWDWEWMNVM